MSDKDGNGFDEQDVEFGNPRQANLDYAHILDEFKHQQNITLTTMQDSQQILQSKIEDAIVNGLQMVADARIPQQALEHKSVVQETFHEYDGKLDALLRVNQELSHSLPQAMSRCETQIEQRMRDWHDTQETLANSMREVFHHDVQQLKLSQTAVQERFSLEMQDMMNMAQQESHIIREG